VIGDPAGSAGRSRRRMTYEPATTTPGSAAAASRLGLGLAAIGRPAYITTGRVDDLGDPAHRSIEALRARAHELLDAAWANGIRYVDVARSYGLAEAFLGTWLAKNPGRRSELMIGSKWGYEYVGNWRVDAPIHERKDHSLRMFDAQWPQTLLALGSQPDVYLIHSVTPDSPALRDAALLDRLRGLADRGVRVGISTSGPYQSDVLAEALALADSPFRAVQATWNLLEQSATDALSHAHTLQWLVVVKEALANGRLTVAARPAPAQELALADAQRMDAFAIGAVLAQPWVDVVLTGAVTPSQLLTNLAAQVPRSKPDELAALAISSTEYWQARSKLKWS
jgi:aryl-alcohol dehydrogenase-like predicted oxidoreductase